MPKPLSCAGTAGSLQKHFINILIYMTLTARTVELPLFIFHPRCRYLATPNRLPITHHLNQ
ncbi:hypothetical protein CI661_0006315 [Klebsiella pneumoniae subsp. pneumoniae]|nr:hypothetical protein CI661_0006315 [Klebsiella pneumoniae subsp. pneumoniae]